MSSEQGVSVTPTGSAEPQTSCKRRRLPTPPTSSSPDSSCDSKLQPPPLPYVPGPCFDINPHNPPPPLDNGAWYEKPDPKEWNRDPWPRGKGAPDAVVEQLLAHPPRKTIPHPDQTARCLQVTHQIRCGDPCKAQVVRCLVEGRDLVAKILDPLYVELDYEWDFPPTYFSERFYSCEAAAYTRVKERGLDGCSDWVPKQYDGETNDTFEGALKWMKDRWEGSSQYEPVNYGWVRGPSKDDSTEDDASEEDSSDDNSSEDGSFERDPTEEDSTTDNYTTRRL